MRTLSPEIKAKASSKFKGLEREDCEPSRIRVVSSAYWDILH